MASTVRLMCPNLSCRSLLSVPVAARGKTVRCSRCGLRVSIPAKPATPASPVETPAKN